MTAEHDVAEPEVDVAAVQHLITEALGATGQLPRRERLVELDEQLRGEIERVVPDVRKRAETAEERSREWYALHSALDQVNDTLQRRLPETPLAGSIHVAELARRLCTLQQAEGAQP
ncbi:DUF6415 family natural product biosynthesis protein [Streptomyces sp. NPDC059544]|uniref:DUF6415 family natural product biosynthesis protein n=1 Tax=Streptomyces sp. NPDC059544 TaxID=3346861 RepID=UPI0036CE201F